MIINIIKSEIEVVMMVIVVVWVEVLMVVLMEFEVVQDGCVLVLKQVGVLFRVVLRYLSILTAYIELCNLYISFVFSYKFKGCQLNH